MFLFAQHCSTVVQGLVGLGGGLAALPLLAGALRLGYAVYAPVKQRDEARAQARDAAAAIRLRGDLEHLRGHGEGILAADFDDRIASAQFDTWLNKLKIALERGGEAELFDRQFRLGRTEASVRTVGEVRAAVTVRMHAIDDALGPHGKVTRRFRPGDEY